MLQGRAAAQVVTRRRFAHPQQQLEGTHGIIYMDEVPPRGEIADLQDRILFTACS